MTTTEERSRTLHMALIRKMDEIRTLLPPGDVRLTLIAHPVDDVERSIMLSSDTVEGLEAVLAVMRRRAAERKG